MIKQHPVSFTFHIGFILLMALGTYTVPAKGQFSSDQFYLGEFGRYVPEEGTFTAQIQVLDYTSEVKNLTDRLQAAIDADNAWFNEYAKQTPVGEQLPYHPNFGLSQSEYTRVLEAEDTRVLESAGTTQLVIHFRRDQVISVNGLPGEAPFDQFLYEPVSDSVLSSYGVLSKSVNAEGSLGANRLLNWKGRVWKRSEASESRQIDLVYVLGELKNEPKNILIHQITGFIDQQPIDYHYVLVWNKQ